MAWVQDEPWDMEQGLPALKIFQFFEDQEQLIPWPGLALAEVRGTLSDLKGKEVHPLVIETDSDLGIVKLKLHESIVNSLKLGPNFYRYDCLWIPPTPLVDSDDNFLVEGPVNIILRTTRRSV